MRYKFQIVFVRSFVNNSLEQSPALEASSSSASREFPRISCNLKVHYRVHKHPPCTLSRADQSSSCHPNVRVRRRPSEKSIRVRGLVWHRLTCWSLRWWDVSHYASPQTGEPPFVGYPRLRICCFRGYLRYLEAVSCIGYPRTRHALTSGALLTLHCVGSGAAFCTYSLNSVITS